MGHLHDDVFSLLRPEYISEAQLNKSLNLHKKAIP